MRGLFHGMIKWMTLLKQIQKILDDAPDWTHLPLAVPNDLVELARKKGGNSLADL